MKKISLRRIVSITVISTIVSILIVLFGIAFNSSLTIVVENDVSNWATLVVAIGLGIFIAIIVKFASDRDILIIKQGIQEKQIFENNQRKYVLKTVLQSIDFIDFDIQQIEKNIIELKNENKKELLTSIILSDWSHVQNLSNDLYENHTYLLFFLDAKIIKDIEILKQRISIKPQLDDIDGNYYIHEFKEIKELIQKIITYVKKELANKLT